MRRVPRESPVLQVLTGLKVRRESQVLRGLLDHRESPAPRARKAWLVSTGPRVLQASRDLRACRAHRELQAPKGHRVHRERKVHRAHHRTLSTSEAGQVRVRTCLVKL